MLRYIKLLLQSVRPVRFTCTEAGTVHLGFRIQKAGQLDNALDFGVTTLKHKTRHGQYSAVVTAGFFQRCIAFECNGLHFAGL